jgi:hypothetical protein
MGSRLDESGPCLERISPRARTRQPHMRWFGSLRPRPMTNQPPRIQVFWYNVSTAVRTAGSKPRGLLARLLQVGGGALLPFISQTPRTNARPMCGVIISTGSDGGECWEEEGGGCPVGHGHMITRVFVFPPRYAVLWVCAE